ncbi:MAG: putative Protein-tyrosine kinase, partial [Deltaproteobacteria bacterium]|nr:putative Protein-tyrosine kinase [Deltaproteobacteria bacterium]
KNEHPGIFAQLLGRFSYLYGLIQDKLHPPPPHDGISVNARSSQGGLSSIEPDLPPLPPGVGRYIGWLDVLPVTNTRMIKVSFATPSAKLSKRLANAHVQKFIQRGLQAKFELTGEARRFLENEIHRVELELGQSEDALNQFRRTHNVVSLDDKDPTENSNIERLADLARRLTAAQADRITAEAEYHLVKSRDSDSLPAVLASSTIGALKNEVSQLEVKQAELGETFLPGSPQLQEVNSKLRQARAQLEREITRAISGSESLYLAAQSREDALRTEFEGQQAAVLDLKELSGQYLKLQQAVNANRSLYGTLLTRMHETDVVKGVQIASASIVDPAEEPWGPSEPQVALDLVFALIFGLAIGVSLSFVLENMDASLKTPDDVRKLLRLPTLGVVPNFAYSPRVGMRNFMGLRRRLTGSEGASSIVTARRGDVVRLVPHLSLHAEAYRGIRTSLLFCNPEKPLRTVLVTSSEAGEGKTSTTVNLAISLTSLGNKVIVVDADMRQARCHESLGIPAGPGLANVLRGEADLDQVVQRLSLRDGQVTSAMATRNGDLDLDILQSGSQVLDPSELIASPRMGAILETLCERYDIVLIDSPPIFPVTDAAILATIVDGVVLVVRGQRTGREITREALERLRFMKATVVGVILNGVDPESSEYNRYAYYFGSERVA